MLFIEGGILFSKACLEEGGGFYVSNYFDHFLLALYRQYVLGQLIYIYSRPISSQCSLLTHKFSVCHPAFVLQKEINHYYYYYYYYY